MQAADFRANLYWAMFGYILTTDLLNNNNNNNNNQFLYSAYHIMTSLYALPKSFGNYNNGF